MSTQAATVATALALVSCPGTRQIYHGDTETKPGKHIGEVNEAMEVMKLGHFLDICGFIRFMITDIFISSIIFPFAFNYLMLSIIQVRGCYFILLLAQFFIVLTFHGNF